MHRTSLLSTLGRRYLSKNDDEELIEKFGFSHVKIILSPSIAMRKFSKIKAQMLTNIK